MAIFLPACANPNADFLQGQWERSNVHFFDRWTFDGGRFSHVSGIQVGNPSILTGRFSIIESQDEQLVVELYDLTGQFIEDPQQIIIIIDEEADSLKIRGKIYPRLRP